MAHNNNNQTITIIHLKLNKHHPKLTSQNLFVQCLRKSGTCLSKAHSTNRSASKAIYIHTNVVLNLIIDNVFRREIICDKWWQQKGFSLVSQFLAIKLLVQISHSYTKSHSIRGGLRHLWTSAAEQLMHCRTWDNISSLICTGSPYSWNRNAAARLCIITTQTDSEQT